MTTFRTLLKTGLVRELQVIEAIKAAGGLPHWDWFPGANALEQNTDLTIPYDLTFTGADGEVESIEVKGCNKGKDWYRGCPSDERLTVVAEVIQTSSWSFPEWLAHEPDWLVYADNHYNMVHLFIAKDFKDYVLEVAAAGQMLPRGKTIDWCVEVPLLHEAGYVGSYAITMTEQEVGHYHGAQIEEHMKLIKTEQVYSRTAPHWPSLIEDWNRHSVYLLCIDWCRASDCKWKSSRSSDAAFRTLKKPYWSDH